MELINHDYDNKKFMRTFTSVFNVVGIVFPFIIIILGVIVPVAYQQTLTIGDILTVIFMALFSRAIIVMVGNYSVGITSDSKGLYIEFFWKQLFVPWESITDLKPIFNITHFKNIWVIRTNALTPFHRLYGIFYSFSISPCIVYNTNISESGELHKRIKSNLDKNNKKSK